MNFTCDDAPLCPPEAEFPFRSSATRAAMQALADRRLADARMHIATVPNDSPSQRTTGNFLRARAAILGNDWTNAERFLQGAQLELDALPNQVTSETIRFRAAILENLGFVLRRLEKIRHAREAHLAAHDLRLGACPPDEQFESAQSLALTAVLEQNYSEATRWLEAALRLAPTCSSPRGAFALAFTSLARVQKALRLLDEAIASARRALAVQLALASETTDIPELQMELAGIIMEKASAALEQSDFSDHRTRSEPITIQLQEAIELLKTASRELHAFGPPAALQARRCDEQLDLARRLSQSFIN